MLVKKRSVKAPILASKEAYIRHIQYHYAVNGWTIDDKLTSQHSIVPCGKKHVTLTFIGRKWVDPE